MESHCLVIIVDNQIFTHTTKINDNCKMMLEGKDIDRYFLNWGGIWIEYGSWLAEPRSENLFKGERILLRRISIINLRHVSCRIL